MVDLPDPESPVSHTVHPLWPFNLLRSSRVTAPWCQTMFVAFCSAIGRRALARSVPGWQALANFVLALACTHGVSPKTTGWCRLPGDRLSTEAFRTHGSCGPDQALHRTQPGRLAARPGSCSGPDTTPASSTSRTSSSFRSRRRAATRSPTIPACCVGARAKEYVWNCYTPFSDREYELLLETLREFDPDLIGFSLTSLTHEAGRGDDRAAEAALPRLPDHLGRRRSDARARLVPRSTPTWCASARARS